MYFLAGQRGQEGKPIMISMITLNVRLQTILDGPNQFNARKESIVTWLKEEKPDIVALQEVVGGMLDAFRESMPGYGFVARSSKRSPKGEYTAIAFLKDTLRLEDSGAFWLSPRPEKPGSRFFLQSPDPRVCTWAEFSHRNGGARFRYFNTHLDHLSPLARARGLEVVFRHMARLQERERLPLFFGGDFNFTPQSALYATCLQRTILGQRLVDLTDSIPSTFHWFGAMKRPMKLDYVFTDDMTIGDVIQARLLPTDGEKCLSDHHAIRLEWVPYEKRPVHVMPEPAIEPVVIQGVVMD